MSQEKHADEEVSFGERLLGMQGFSAARAKKYRAELEKLLVHRMTQSHRWTIGLMGLYLLGALCFLGGEALIRREGPFNQMFPMARWAVAGSFVISGLSIGAWLVWIAVRGGFSRRVGDLMAIIIVLAFSGSFAALFFWFAWDVDEVTRTKLLIGSATLAACLIGCIALAIAQRMHRQTQEKLLRIEYHLAQLMEDHAGSSPT